MMSGMPETKTTIPEAFWQRLERIIPEALLPQVLTTFRNKRPVFFRGNPLKGGPDAAVLEADSPEAHRQEVEEGKLYIQGLSSMLVGRLLGAEPGERVLDLCAAPGSKTGHIAALMQNTGEIVAVERVRERMYKLKSVLTLLGVTNTACVLTDGRRFQPATFFDRALVDAPCSSEGRFLETVPKTYRYWSERKIREMRRKQRGLLHQATRLVKPGGIILYSTCTFAPEENEGVIDWLLRKTAGAWETASLDEVWPAAAATYPALTRWGEKDFDPAVAKCRRILPTEKYEGFFIAKLKRKD